MYYILLVYIHSGIIGCHKKSHILVNGFDLHAIKGSHDPNINKPFPEKLYLLENMPKQK